jgi:hypothetical protein
MAARTFRTTLWREGNLCAIRVPFDPKAVFGRTRAPVKVTLNGYTYRSTIAAMGGELFIPLRKSNREAAGLQGTETLEVRLELDTAIRQVSAPADLVKALKAGGALEAWNALSFSHQREHVEAIEEAKKPETRARRVEKAVATLASAFFSGSPSGSRPGR